MTAFDRILGANTSLTTAQRMSQGAVRAGAWVAIAGAGLIPLGVLLRSPDLQIVGTVAAVSGAIGGAMGAAASSELGERMDALEIERLDADQAELRGYHRGIAEGQSQGQKSAQAMAQQLFKDGFDEGLKSARITAAAELKIEHDRAIAELRRSLESQAKQAIEGRDSRIAESYEFIQDLQSQLTQAQSQIEHLESVAEQGAKSAAELKAVQAKIAAIDERIREADERIESARQAEMEIERAKADLAREYTANFGEFQATLAQLPRLEQDLQSLREANQALRESAAESAEESHAAGYQAGLNEAEKQYAHDLEMASLKIRKLELELGKIRELERLDRSIPALAAILSKRGPQPAIVIGNQGSGKALSALAIADCLRGKAPIIPFVLDISEGGDPNSSWAKAGYPCTADPHIFLSFLKAVRYQLDAGNLPHRNEGDSYWNHPLILPIIDEAMSAFNGLEKEEIEWIAETLTVIETRGAKRRIVPIVLTISEQIQNLSCKKIKIFNTGRLDNYTTVALNEKLLNLATADQLKANPELKGYLEAFDGRFIAGTLIKGARGEIWHPLKHPSHYQNLLTEPVPNVIPQPPLAPPPDWLPAAVRAVYIAAGLNPTELPPNHDPEPLNPPQGATLRALPGGRGDSPDLGGEDGSGRTELIRKLAAQGVSATAIAEQISGKKKGGSKAFLQARDEVLIALNKGDE